MLTVVIVGELPGADLPADLFSVHQARTGADALALLETADVLVVTAFVDKVVELLLARARDEHPRVIRVGQIGAAGSTDVEHLRLAHLVLEHEVTGAELERVLVRAAMLHGQLDPAVLASFLERFDALPGVPSTWAELTTLLTDEEVSITAIAEVIGRDVVLTAEVLRQANSALFAGSSRVARIEDAIVRLGFSTIQSLVLNAETGRLFSAAKLAGLSVEGLCDEGLARGRRAATLVSNAAARDEAFLAGMLLEIGQLVLGALLASDYRSVRQMAERRDWPLDQAEAVALGVTHAQVGSHLLRTWNLPSSVVRAARDHHLPAPAGPFGPAEAAVAALQHADEGDGGAAAEDSAAATPPRRRRQLRADPS